MKKNLYLIGGTMGTGKTTVCQILKTKLENSVFLDGDWCWDMHPFRATEETKGMVIDNICYLINNYIHCSVFENIIFCWVMHEQSVIDVIMSKLDISDCDVRIISLVCNKEVLEKRLQKDIDRGIRTPDILEKSIGRIPLYDKLKTVKLDVSNMSAAQASERIIGL